jgi:hypothetical protein
MAEVTFATASGGSCRIGAFRIERVEFDIGLGVATSHRGPRFLTRLFIAALPGNRGFAWFPGHIDCSDELRFALIASWPYRLEALDSVASNVRAEFRYRTARRRRDRPEERCSMTTRLAFLFPAALISVALAQAPEDRSAAIKEALAGNQAALRQYTWVETTAISLKGEVKKQEKKQCSYGADGKVQKTPLPGQAEPKQQAQQGGGRRGGRVKQAVVENKVEELKDYMEKAAALVHQYVPPDPQKLQEAQSAGNVAVQPADGLTTLNVKNYVKSGDSLTIGFDPSAKAMRSYGVKSYVEKPKEDDLTLSVKFNSLPDGTTYPETIVLDVTGKKVVVNVTNSGYKKAGQ